MKALKYMGPNTLEIHEEERPVPKADEVLIRVRGCGICGSDVHGYLGKTGRRIPPMTMGHEFSGEIVETGKDVSKWKVGEGVIVQPINFCGKCENCAKGLTNLCLNRLFFGVLEENGAMTEYLAVPQKLLYALPKSCSFHEGALAEPYAVAYGSVKKAGDMLRGKNVLIIGAGMIGLCILQMVKLHAPKKIIVLDLSDTRLVTAKKLGADYTINPAKEDAQGKIAEYTDGKMADFSFEAVGVEPTANQSIKLLKKCGTAIWVGMSQREMQINMQDIVCSARKVIGSFNYTHEEFGEVVQLLGSGKLAMRELISEIVSLEDAPEAFEALYKRPDDFIKVIVDPTK